MKTAILAIMAFILLVAGAAWYWAPQPVEAPATGPTDYKNATYIVNGAPVMLINGHAETEAAPGSAAKIVTDYFGNEVRLDLNGDGREDIAFLLTQQTGGSGTFYYAAAALDTESGWVGSQAFFLGDRIAPQTTERGTGGTVLVNYADRAPGESFTTRPSTGKSVWLSFDPATLRFTEVANPAGSDLSQSYSDSSDGLSLRYPKGYTIDRSALGPHNAMTIGIKLTVPTTTTVGTNLAPDSYISVEEDGIPESKDCTANLFLDSQSASPVRAVQEDGRIYSVASTTGAGAGNRYEETVYALSGTNPCIAIRYFIHYGVIENYPPGAVRAFDKAALLREFDSIRHTLVVVP